jgi:MFS family permease
MGGDAVLTRAKDQFRLVSTVNLIAGAVFIALAASLARSLVVTVALAGVVLVIGVPSMAKTFRDRTVADLVSVPTVEHADVETSTRLVIRVLVLLLFALGACFVVSFGVGWLLERAAERSDADFDGRAVSLAVAGGLLAGAATGYWRSADAIARWERDHGQRILIRVWARSALRDRPSGKYRLSPRFVRLSR